MHANAMALLFGYLLGSLPVALVVGRLVAGLDIRRHGSRNAGATNVYRVLGWKPALVVLVMDLAKGFLAAWSVPLLVSGDPITLATIAGFGAVLGHCYPVFAGFAGGKGVATAAGMVLAVCPIVFPFCLLVFGVILGWTRFASLASMGGVLAFPLGLGLFQELLNLAVQAPLWIASGSLAVWVLFTHRANILRLLRGEEGKLGKNAGSNP